MKKFAGLFTLLSFFAITANGQLDTFDLSSYKLPEFKRSQLDLNLNLSGSNGFSNHRDEGFDKQTHTSGNLGGPFSLTYNSYENSEKKQLTRLVQLSLSPGFNFNSANGKTLQKSAIIGVDGAVSQVYRNYFRRNLFFEPDIQLIASASSGNYRNVNILTKSSDRYALVDLEVPLLMGKGRIEPVQDARLAVYILEDLYKEGRITRLPGQEEIIALASLISEIKNKRFFDYRIRKIAEIEKVDSFLQAGGFISKADARYFTTLNDNWDNSAGPLRESGRRFSAGLVPNTTLSRTYNKVEYDTTTTDYITKNRTSIFGIRAFADYTVAIPMDLHWQKNWSLNASYGYGGDLYRNTVTDYKLERGSYNLTGKAAYGLGFYPNSRTDVTGTLSLNLLQYMRHETLTGTTNRFKYIELAPAFTLNLHYYISAQMRLNVHYDVGYAFTNLDTKYDASDRYYYYKTNTFNQNLNVGFLYSFY
jgi:hypothetical protein